MAIRLLARIDREILPEHFERLLGDAKGAAVRRRADHAGTGQSLHHPFDRRIHAAGLDDLVADQPPLRAVAVQALFVLDCLAGNTVADRARQPHVGGAGNDALLPRRQRQIGGLLAST